MVAGLLERTTPACSPRLRKDAAHAALEASHVVLLRLELLALLLGCLSQFAPQGADDALDGLIRSVEVFVPLPKRRAFARVRLEHP